MQKINNRNKEDLDDIAYRSIIRMIVENQVKPGDTILETELAENLSISRTPVRQALARLIAEGFLEKKRKKGCVIPIPNSEDAKQVFFAREVIESQVAAAAALNATDHDIKIMKNILEKEREALTAHDKERYSLANEKFHFSIMKAAKNAYLERYCRHIFWRSNVYIFFFDSFYFLDKNLETPPRQLTPIQHSRILNAIADKDSENARIEMRQHIRNTLNSLIGIKG